MYYNVRVTGKLIGGEEDGKFFELKGFNSFATSEVEVLLDLHEHLRLNHRIDEKTGFIQPPDSVPTYGVRHIEVVPVTHRQMLQLDRVLEAITQTEVHLDDFRQAYRLPPEQAERAQRYANYSKRLQDLAVTIKVFGPVEDLDEQLQ